MWAERSDRENAANGRQAGRDLGKAGCLLLAQAAGRKEAPWRLEGPELRQSLTGLGGPALNPLSSQPGNRPAEDVAYLPRPRKSLQTEHPHPAMSLRGHVPVGAL